jgi:hypothetical protein
MTVSNPHSNILDVYTRMHLAQALCASAAGSVGRMDSQRHEGWVDGCQQATAAQLPARASLAALDPVPATHLGLLAAFSFASSATSCSASSRGSSPCWHSLCMIIRRTCWRTWQVRRVRVAGKSWRLVSGHNRHMSAMGNSSQCRGRLGVQAAMRLETAAQSSGELQRAGAGSRTICGPSGCLAAAPAGSCRTCATSPSARPHTDGHNTDRAGSDTRAHPVAASTHGRSEVCIGQTVSQHLASALLHCHWDLNGAPWLFCDHTSSGVSFVCPGISYTFFSRFPLSPPSGFPSVPDGAGCHVSADNAQLMQELQVSCVGPAAACCCQCMLLWLWRGAERTLGCLAALLLWCRLLLFGCLHA